MGDLDIAAEVAATDYTEIITAIQNNTEYIKFLIFVVSFLLGIMIIHLLSVTFGGFKHD